MIATILVVIKMVAAIFSMWRERDVYKKKVKKEALQEVLDGIEKRDSSAITRGFDRINRVR